MSMEINLVRDSIARESSSEVPLNPSLSASIIYRRVLENMRSPMSSRVGDKPQV